MSQAYIQTPAEAANEFRTLKMAYDVAFSAVRDEIEDLARLRDAPRREHSGKDAVR